MYELKTFKNWSWKKMMDETTKFYLLHNPIIKEGGSE